MDRSANTEQDRILELDGIRGMALFMMVFFHLMLFSVIQNTGHPIHHIIKFGWLAIDIFFVLSGYLITNILLSTKDKPGYFRNFYWRRIIRIMPIYYLYLFLFLYVIAPHTSIGATSEFKAITETKIWFLIYLQNIYISTQQILFHFGINDLWSLAIEEQFYLLWPLIVYLFSKEKLKYVIGFVIVFPLIFRIIAVDNYHANWLFIYFFTPARIDCLGFGALAAYYLKYHRDSPLGRKLIMIAGCIGLIGIIIILFRKGEYILFSKAVNRYGYTLNGMVFMFIIVKAATGELPRLVSKIFRNTIFCFYGKISYCFYIVHGVILHFYSSIIIPALSSYGFFKSSSAAFTTVVIIIYILNVTLIASASWYFFESKMLRLKKYFPYT